jgi:RimJ/RimL family protein N-acetyltransferase
VIFETERLIARGMLDKDIAAIAACRAHPEVARYQNWQSYDETTAADLVSDMLLRTPGEPGWLQLVVERKADGAFIGDCGINIGSDKRLAQIGYTIAWEHWNQGYATEIVQNLTSYGFGALKVHRITASVDPRNAPSCRVLEKAGFTKEAHFRQSEWFKGDWADDAVYAILASDFYRRS